MASKKLADAELILIPRQALRLKVLAPGLLVILLAVLAIPSRIIAASSFGGYNSLVALFLHDLRQGILPSNAIFLAQSNSDFQVYVTASLFLALLFGSPLIAFSVFERMLPEETTHRTFKVAALTALSSVSLAIGVLFGYYFTASDLTALLTVGSPGPIHVSIAWYNGVLEIMTLAGLLLATSVCAPALLYFRKRARPIQRLHGFPGRLSGLAVAVIGVFLIAAGLDLYSYTAPTAIHDMRCYYGNCIPFDLSWNAFELLPYAGLLFISLGVFIIASIMVTRRRGAPMPRLADVS
ncbi:MAG: hypothetical protein JRN59_02870 [Nitrososphaerota archaeon]|nr:hypothetical protein [Nitrososphaerota archaeon]